MSLHWYHEQSLIFLPVYSCRSIEIEAVGSVTKKLRNYISINIYFKLKLIGFHPMINWLDFLAKLIDSCLAACEIFLLNKQKTETFSLGKKVFQVFQVLAIFQKRFANINNLNKRCWSSSRKYTNKRSRKVNKAIHAHSKFSWNFHSFSYTASSSKSFHFEVRTLHQFFLFFVSDHRYSLSDIHFRICTIVDQFSLIFATFVYDLQRLLNIEWENERRIFVAHKNKIYNFQRSLFQFCFDRCRFDACTSLDL